MRVLIATDAWHPQVNGVVRTLTSLAASAKGLGVPIEFLTPDGFPSVALPTYANLRLALPNRREIARRIAAARPDAIHVATEGPVGLAARTYCVRRRLPFTTSYTTRFPEYIAARFPIPEALSYAVLRRFHGTAAVTMVSTLSLMAELRARGFHAVAGADEVGRGALFGAVFAGAVILSNDRPVRGLNDSKLLEPERREVPYERPWYWRKKEARDNFNNEKTYYHDDSFADVTRQRKIR